MDFVLGGGIDSPDFKLVYPFDGNGVSAWKKRDHGPGTISCGGGHFGIYGCNPIRVLCHILIGDWFVKSGEKCLYFVMKCCLTHKVKEAAIRNLGVDGAAKTRQWGRGASRGGVRVRRDRGHGRWGFSGAVIGINLERNGGCKIGRRSRD